MAESEIWKTVVGWEGLYEVSNLGRVRSLDRIVKRGDYLQNRHQKILAQTQNKFGYLLAKLSRNGRSRRYMIHRLVAEAFIPNPDNLPQVNHKDENKENNCVENLEWCTRLYNMRYGHCIEKIRNSHINNPKLSKSVAKCDLDGNILETYPSQAEAGRLNNLNGGKISLCCLGKKGRVTHGGYKWKFV